MSWYDEIVKWRWGFPTWRRRYQVLFACLVLILAFLWLGPQWLPVLLHKDAQNNINTTPGLVFKAGDGNSSGKGGDLNIRAGDGGVDGKGGDIIITSDGLN